MQILIKVLFFVIAFLILFSLLIFYISIRPFKMKTNLIPPDFGLEYEEVNFESADGIKLNGWFIPNSKSKSAIIDRGLLANLKDRVQQLKSEGNEHYKKIIDRVSVIFEEDELDILRFIEAVLKAGLDGTADIIGVLKRTKQRIGVIRNRLKTK